MPEPDLARNVQATALAAMLDSAHIAHELSAYRGALTPIELDAPGMEIEALISGAAIHDLGWMRRVAVRGADRFRWLSGMVTNTVNDLFPNTGAWNLVLNAQGHIQGDLTVWRGGEEASPQRRSPTGAANTPVGRPNRLLGTPFAGESELELEIAADQTDKLLAHLEGRGVLAHAIAPSTMRLVTHHDVDDEGIERAMAALADAPGGDAA